MDIRTVLAESDNYSKGSVREAEYAANRFNEDLWLHLDNFAPLTPSARKEVEARLADAAARNDSRKTALIHCGIVPIEMAIRTYVQKYAKTAKIKNIVDTFSKRLESAGCLENAKQRIAENQDKQKEILDNIEAIKKKLAHGDEAKRFKSRIEAINYDAEVKRTSESIVMEALRGVTDLLARHSSSKYTREEAEALCKEFAKSAEALQAKFQVKLENLIENHVCKSAAGLLNEYKKKSWNLIRI